MADALLVEDPGLLTTLQDRGRFGYQRFGISPSGAMDPGGLAIANALVGNAPDEAVLEITLSGLSLAVEADLCRVALAGDQPVAVNGVPAPPLSAIDLARGDRLRIGPVRTGARTYLGVAGGFAVEPVLGSRSTHTRTRIGGLHGGALKRGDRLPLRSSSPVGPRLALHPPHMPAHRHRPVRAVMGPQDHAFTERGLITFLATEWHVSARSDRMGSHLEGPAIEHRAGYNILSDGIVAGSVQVPGTGQPIVLLADRQTTGGYTKIATVITADLAILGQKRPGDVVRFEAVTVEAAIAAAESAREDIKATLARIAPANSAGGAFRSADLLGINLVDGVVSAVADPFSPGPTAGRAPFRTAM